MNNKILHWDGSLPIEGVKALSSPAGMIVSPSKVGYIIITTGIQGLNRKFEAKKRRQSKPAVILCGSLEELFELANLDEKVKTFYVENWNNGISVGCILPWSEKGKSRLKSQNIDYLVADQRNTSCFVINFGIPSEMIVKELWKSKGLIAFASSANPSGESNKGKIQGIGERISEEADIIIEADDYVKSIQPNANEDNRYEQSVMVSMVNDSGELVSENSQTVKGIPKIIRKGLDIDKVMITLSNIFKKWDYRDGDFSQ